MPYKNRESRLEYSRGYYIKNKDHLKKLRILHFEKNKELILSNWRKRYHKNREKELKMKRIKYYENVEIMRERGRKYYRKNSQRLCDEKKEFYKKNKKNIKKLALKNYYKNRKIKLEQMKKWQKDNKEKIRKYIFDNKEKLNLKKRERYHYDRQYKILINLRCTTNKAIRNYSKNGKIKNSKEYGINYLSIIEYLKPFPKDIFNYHIDHIRPLCSFDLTNPKEIKKAFAPENHQWLTAHENHIKWGKY